MPVDLHELWAYRELVAAFTMRDVKLRYKQTGLGIAWAVLQPLLTMVIFTIFFGGLAHIPSDGVPYPLFVLAALLPWTLFSDGLTRSTTSMVTNSTIMTKVYFPRLIMPLASIISPLVDFAVSFIILLVMMVYYGFVPTLNIIFLPLFLLLALATSLGVGLWLSALNVKYRDFQYTVPFLIQIWMFASPVVYASSLVPASLRVWYGLNPMAGVIEGFRWTLARCRGTQRDGACLGGHGYPAPCFRYVLFPEDGAVLCGYCVTETPGDQSPVSLRSSG